MSHLSGGNPFRKPDNDWNRHCASSWKVYLLVDKQWAHKIPQNEMRKKVKRHKGLMFDVTEHMAKRWVDFAVGRTFKVNAAHGVGVPPLTLLSENPEACSRSLSVFPGIESCFQAQQTLYWTCFLWPASPSPRPHNLPILSYTLWILFPPKGEGP